MSDTFPGAVAELRAIAERAARFVDRCLARAQYWARKRNAYAACITSGPDPQSDRAWAMTIQAAYRIQAYQALAVGDREAALRSRREARLARRSAAKHQVRRYYP